MVQQKLRTVHKPVEISDDSLNYDDFNAKLTVGQVEKSKSTAEFLRTRSEPLTSM